MKTIMMVPKHQGGHSIDVFEVDKLLITREHNGDLYQLNYSVSGKSVIDDCIDIMAEGKKVFVVYTPGNTGTVKYWIYKTMTT